MTLKTSDHDTPTKKLLLTWLTEDGVSIEGIRQAMTDAKKKLKRSGAEKGWIRTRTENGSTQMFLVIEK